MVTKFVGLADRSGLSLGALTKRGAAFPSRWSQLLGNIALFSFVLVLVTGVPLLFWYKASSAPVTYDGSYDALFGVRMSEAYASTLDTSFEVTGGLLIRQTHHWASLVFIAALSAHLMYLFFTGSFRGPRRVSWVIVLGMLVLGIAAAYMGHGLPDDMLSGTGLRVTEGYMAAIPFVGTGVSWIVFGGEFPGDDILVRLNVVHALVLPSLIIALFVINTAVTKRWRASHPAPVGERAASSGYIAKMSGFMLMVFGVIFAMAATIQANPVWLWGPFDPAQAPAGSVPPWYLGFLDGAVRLMPAFSLDIAGHELNLSVLVPAIVLPGLIMGALALYPWFEQWVMRDQRDPFVVDRPRDMPVRTGLGAGFVAFYLVLWLAGGVDSIATTLQTSVNGIIRVLQVSVFVLPPLAFWVAKRISLGLQLRDQEELVHGHPSGTIMVSPDGGFAEEHMAPAGTDRVLASHPDYTVLNPGAATDAYGVRDPEYPNKRRRAALSRFYFSDVSRTPPAHETDDH
jgi:ubiquinol-cytochrome c reductase cytochrome b subunit